MTLLGRVTNLLKRSQIDPMADPAVLSAIGDAVRERLRANPLAEERGGPKSDLFLLPGFLSQDECNRLIDLIESRIQPSPTFSERKSSRGRTSSTHFFSNEAKETLALGRKIDEALGLERTHAETIQGQRYREGEEYRYHRDYFLEDRPHWQTQRQRGGQRSWTAMVYLNSVDAGGETDFPELELSVTPATGTLITWNNMDHRGRPNRCTRHAALPVERGQKYVITQWYRQEEWQRHLR